MGETHAEQRHTFTETGKKNEITWLTGTKYDSAEQLAISPHSIWVSFKRLSLKTLNEACSDCVNEL